MKRTVVKGLLRGREIVRLLPEDEEDLRVLERLDEVGLLDSNESFGDSQGNKPGERDNTA